MSKKDDAERLERDVLRAFAQVARRRLSGKEHPDYISDNELNSNGTHRKKTVRLMRENGYLGSSITIKGPNRWGGTTSTRRTQVLKFDTESKALASKGVFKRTWQQLYQELYHFIYKNSFDLVGYIEVDKLPHVAVIDVYWHPEEYDRLEYKKSAYFYPKEWLRERMVNTLRCIVERKFNEGFAGELEKRAGLPKDSLPTKYTIDTSIRNFAYTPFHFNEDGFNGAEGFLAELDHQVAYMKALRKRVQAFANLAAATGGFDELVRQYRKALITELIEDSPLKAFQEVEEHDFYNNNYEVYGAKYLLAHSDLFDYDTMYASGEETAYINRNNVSMSSPYINHDLMPEQERKLIDAEATVEPSKVPSSSDQEEKTACLAKMTTEILASISKPVPQT